MQMRFDIALDDVQPGDWALHKGGVLDPRQVTAVDVDKGLVFLDILGTSCGPFPLDNYEYSRVVG